MVARSISHDFVKRPRHYRAITNKVADILQGFRIRTGSTPEWLSGIQRARVYTAIFGASFCSTSVGIEDRICRFSWNEALTARTCWRAFAMLRSHFAATYGQSRGQRSREQTAKLDRFSGAPSKFCEMSRLRVCLACQPHRVGTGPWTER